MSKSKKKKPCKRCKEYFARFRCGVAINHECDCPKCQGLCECET